MLPSVVRPWTRPSDVPPTPLTVLTRPRISQQPPKRRSSRSQVSCTLARWEAALASLGPAPFAVLGLVPCRPGRPWAAYILRPTVPSRRAVRTVETLCSHHAHTVQCIQCCYTVAFLDPAVLTCSSCCSCDWHFRRPLRLRTLVPRPLHPPHLTLSTPPPRAWVSALDNHLASPFSKRLAHSLIPSQPHTITLRHYDTTTLRQ